MLRVAHLVNPFKASPSSELAWVQPITYESMRVARDFAAGKVEVSLLSAQYPEDRSMVPEGFTPTPDLQRSVLDLGPFKERRKLPLLADLIERLYEGSDAEWLVYSDNDITLMPHFYSNSCLRPAPDRTAARRPDPPGERSVARNAPTHRPPRPPWRGSGRCSPDV